MLLRRPSSLVAPDPGSRNIKHDQTSKKKEREGGGEIAGVSD